MGKIILRLDRVMADRKMSLKELSEIVCVSNVNLSKMKTGKISAIRFSTLVAICEALDCQPGDILEYDKNADSQKKSSGNAIMGGVTIQNSYRAACIMPPLAMPEENACGEKSVFKSENAKNTE